MSFFFTFFRKNNKSQNTTTYSNLVSLFDHVRDYVMNYKIPHMVYEETLDFFNSLSSRVEENENAKRFYRQQVEPIVNEFLSLIEKDGIQYVADVDYAIGLMEKILSKVKDLEEEYF